ncbi:MULTISPECIES: 3-hydroxyacyl-CoA dehydrogenase NAD-binding domain-containing protein [Prauserella salsuginis group]|uniref:3-hydroxyacyl-CoA dehydrogenase/enoyl-CoA hydratase/3-hydroxybutyryl-CoA epimerase n=2 Tax=Prauserella salsuginis group TaxID=2893672 RepID=A0A839XTT9_9PSEU|nr:MULTISPECIES: 3-hydroxyacyl-CoA dehydrogenase NAD-binding domain-containing protein [Prauserella salsuginis group]MBB3663983.1 3-hydroxyacyl-CoA dehydrogenase/enoyl-CoA hydratase/3-hydroxybutyryl-CoA epimerase [Prauserella sediminis]MCR3721439.1 3-hydroxyacyl-CoA dehydrogenase / enoyl-CoA hydratase / 3-hydroxybutyryl-CoA epimerase [Prauserella flava]MCR3732429.1 3-hydroxyacyl-CoA dehydrogenase / enoyl-CoA hydratase / 3-hydroxybutyryl-CoA epimerase [Prauserella salsuginis]
MTEAKTIRWEQDSDGIVTLTMDDPKQSANTMNADYRESMGVVLNRLESEKDSITGVVLTSAKKTFFAGGDLNDLIKATPDDAAEVTEASNELKGQLRRLETLGKPVVAAINGAALGGGLEIALACHRRIVADVKGTAIGLPEVSLGLLPGGGGIVRTVRLLGIQSAIMNVLVQGQRHRPAKALELGLVDELVSSVDELLPKAKAWIKENPEGGVQPWDQKGFKIPGGSPSNPKFAANLPAFPANLRKQLKGAPMPAPRAILSAAVEGAQVDVETAGLIETRYFVSLVTGQVAKNMTKAFFFDLQAINAGESRPDGHEQYQAKKVGVLGAGMMGAAIAYVSAKAGIDVVLKDVSQENAEKGKGYAVKLEEKALKRGKTTQEKSDALLGRITPSADPADLKGVDFVIEAVFESTELKHKVFQEIEDVVNPDAVLGSNTSTLPITGLAEGVQRQEDFIGIHFFSPVDKMPLVEIIRGEKTSDATLAKVFDYTLQIKKTPIVVNDSRGFFTSRVIGTFIAEAVAALGEGVEPATIEQAGSQAGYPAPPLQLMDELTLTLPRKIRLETKEAIEAAGGTWDAHPSEAIIDRMIDEYDRKGRSTGSGFYDYDDEGNRTQLWPGLREAFNSGSGDVPFEDLKERMLFAEALETVKCFDEGVLNTVEDANIGSIMGIGFPPWTGGVIQYINGYEGGLKGFVARSKELAARYGSHFEPPASLVAKAEKGEIYE